MPDKFQLQATSLISPLIGGFAITPDDGNDLASTTRQIRVTGNGGTLSVLWADGSSSVEPVSSGDVWDWRIVRVLATGTTATGLRGYV